MQELLLAAPILAFVVMFGIALHAPAALRGLIGVLDVVSAVVLIATSKPHLAALVLLGAAGVLVGLTEAHTRSRLSRAVVVVWRGLPNHVCILQSPKPCSD